MLLSAVSKPPLLSLYIGVYSRDSRAERLFSIRVNWCSFAVIALLYSARN
jgi:hypothetical protein